MEYLEKIFYNLSIYLIPGSFFLLGLLLAYWIWCSHSRRLQVSLKEHRKLLGEMALFGTVDLTDLKRKIYSKMEAVDQTWQVTYNEQISLLKERDKYIELRKLEHTVAKSALESKVQELAVLEQSFQNYKREQEAAYNSILNEKKAIETTLNSFGSDTSEVHKEVGELQGENAHHLQTIAMQEAKIRELENKLASSSSVVG